MSMIDEASTLIDQYCSRTDGDGNGSLVYTTYVQRVQMQSPNRNIARLSFKPLVAVDAATRQTLSDLHDSTDNNGGPYYYTGFQANDITNTANNALSPILSCSGRYGYVRRDASAMLPDLNYLANPLQITALFGGPPGFQYMDASQIDCNYQTGAIWVPVGLYFVRYTELVVTYNSGFDPRHMPKAIKRACALVVRNMIVRGGISGVKSLNASKVSATFAESLIDQDIQVMLQPFVNVIMY